MRCFVAVVAALLLSTTAGRVGAAKDSGRLIVAVDRSELGRVGTLPGQVSDVAVDRHGNLFMADNFVGARSVDIRCQVRERLAATGAIRVVAGWIPGEAHGGTAAQRLALSACRRLAVDADDHVYLISTRHPWGRYPLQLFRISAGSGAVQAIAGCVRCYGFHPGRPATRSSMDYVMDLAVDRSGGVLLPNAYTGEIWRLTPRGALKRVAANVCRIPGNLHYVCPDLIAPGAGGTIYFGDNDARVEALALATGKVSIVAGGGSCRSHRYALCGNHILATKAKLEEPQDIAVDNAGNLLIADDVVQRVDAKTHRIEILAGNGNLPSSMASRRRGESFPALTTAIEPWALEVSPAGAIFIAEEMSGSVLELHPAG